MLELFLYSLIQGVWKTSSSGEVKRKCYCWLGVKRAVVIKELRTYQWSSVGAELAWCCYFFVGLELECTHLWLWLGSSLTCWSICLFSPFPKVFGFEMLRSWIRMSNVQMQVHVTAYIVFPVGEYSWLCAEEFFFSWLKQQERCDSFPWFLWKQHDLWDMCLW